MSGYHQTGAKPQRTVVELVLVNEYDPTTDEFRKEFVPHRVRNWFDEITLAATAYGARLLLSKDMRVVLVAWCDGV